MLLSRFHKRPTSFPFVRCAFFLMPHKNVMQSRSLHHQANAILDRLLHHCHLVKIIGKSYRTKDLTKELNDSSEDGV